MIMFEAAPNVERFVSEVL